MSENILNTLSEIKAGRMSEWEAILFLRDLRREVLRNGFSREVTHYVAVALADVIVCPQTVGRKACNAALRTFGSAVKHSARPYFIGYRILNREMCLSANQSSCEFMLAAFNVFATRTHPAGVNLAINNRSSLLEMQKRYPELPIGRKRILQRWLAAE